MKPITENIISQKKNSIKPYYIELMGIVFRPSSKWYIITFSVAENYAIYTMVIAMDQKYPESYAVYGHYYHLHQLFPSPQTRLASPGIFPRL